MVTWTEVTYQTKIQSEEKRTEREQKGMRATSVLALTLLVCCIFQASFLTGQLPPPAGAVRCQRFVRAPRRMLRSSRKPLAVLAFAGHTTFVGAAGGAWASAFLVFWWHGANVASCVAA